MKKAILMVATIILNIMTMNAKNQPNLTLNNGVKMPQFTGIDLLIDGGLIASIRTGQFQLR